MARGTWGGALDPNIFKVTIRFLLGVQQCQCGFHLRDVGVQDNSEQDVADEVLAQTAASFRNLLKPTDTLLAVDARILGQDTGATADAGNLAGLQPADAGTSEPSFLAAVLTLKSEVRKRYGQGRMFLPCAVEGFVSGDILTVDATNNYATFITALTDHFTGDPVTHDLLMVNAHGTLPARPPSGSYPGRPEIPPSWYDVLSLRMNTIVTHLRSRKVGVGS